MNTKIYEKTRYQNIYRNIKNKNYIIMMSVPVKTSIATFNGKKIYDIDTAKKVKDNILIKAQKSMESKDKETFDTLWEEYINYCKFVKKQAYNTIIRKQKDYNKYLKGKIEIKVSKADRNFWVKYINDLNCSNKQKNQIIKSLKTFFNWLKSDEVNLIINNPLLGIKNYKVEKEEMKYWTPEELKKFLNCTQKDKSSEDAFTRDRAYLIYTLVTINFSLGDRIGETRALTFGDFDKEKLEVKVRHSIEYDPNSKNDVKDTKTPESRRTLNVSQNIIDIVEDYKCFLVNEKKVKITDDTLIFYNHQYHCPYSDTSLRDKFNICIENAHVKKIRLYDLRHTFAATMMAEGFELYHISKMMGHKNYSTTVNSYGHIRDDIKDKIAKTTDKYL